MVFKVLGKLTLAIPPNVNAFEPILVTPSGMLTVKSVYDIE